MINPHWQATKIGQLGRIVTGKTPPSTKPGLFGNNHPFITPTDLDNDSRNVLTERFVSDEGAAAFKNQMIPAGAVCFVCIGSIGKMCVASRLSLTNQQLNSIVVDDRVHDARFVYYALRQIAPIVKGLAGGAATPIVSKSSFSAIEVLMPPLTEQGRIASILSAYDDLIENNTRRIAILEEMARRIYEEWFVRFRFPGHENVRLVESETPVPNGWQVRDVKDLVRRLPIGKVYKEANVRIQGQTPVVDQSTSEMLGFHDDEPAHQASAASPVVIFGDHTCKMQLMVTPFSLGPNTVPFIANELPVHYVYALVRGLVTTREYKRHWSDLMKKSVLVAPREVAMMFTNAVGPMAELTEVLRRRNRNLGATRDLLLPKLISGELDVSTLPEPETAVA